MDQMSAPTGPGSWFSIWLDAVTHPSEQTFARIAQSPNASFGTACLWVFIGGTAQGLISAVLGAILELLGFHARFPGLGGGAQAGRASGSILLSICLSPVGGIVSVIAFIILAAIFQGMAALFRGSGSFTKLTYPLAAISVPISLVVGVLVPFLNVPVLDICMGILLFAVLIYNLVLEVLAIKAVNQFGIGAAIGSALALPVLLILCACLAIFILMLMGPTIGNVFSTINQSLMNP